MALIIPDELRQAHEDGKVVFFCGAGVSRPTLPDFPGLTHRVVEAFCPSRRQDPLPWNAFEGSRYDEALDLIERNVRGGYRDAMRPKVRDILFASLKGRRLDLRSHLALCRLSGLTGRQGRLVTTNFDPLFDRAFRNLKIKPRSEVGPALSPPKPSTWAGIVYLHGKIGPQFNDRDLVLTTADFGKAYLLDGWARRFVIELFRHYHVVFVGYSIEDPTMRYLVSALAAAREGHEGFLEPYSFAEYRQSGEVANRDEAVALWSGRGVTPIPFDNTSGDYTQLWHGLEQWGDDHVGGLDSKFQIVTRYGKGGPSDAPDEAVNQLCWALGDTDVTRSIVPSSGDPLVSLAWLQTFHEKGLMAAQYGAKVAVPLVSHQISDGLQLDERTHQMAIWAASFLSDNRLVDWVIAQGGVMHGTWRHLVRNRLRHSSALGSGYRKIWQVLSDDSYAHNLAASRSYFGLFVPKLSPDDPEALQVFLDRLRPIPVFLPSYTFPSSRKAPDPSRPSSICRIELRLVGIDKDFNVEQFRKASKNWGGALAAIAEDITSLLHQGMDWLNHFGLASPTHDNLYSYRDLSSFGATRRDHYVNTWTWLVALSWEAYEALRSVSPDAAARLASRWQTLHYPIFRRLALIAAARG